MKATNAIHQELLRKLKSKEAVILVAGLGYVGFPLVIRYALSGYRSLGLDIDPQKAEKINAGESYIRHIASELVVQAKAAGLEADTRPERVAEADAILVCVPTPLNKYREPDLSFVINTVRQLAPHMHKGQILSLESTTYPGTTEEILQPILEEQGFTIGEDCFLVYSPEREDPGNVVYQTRDIPKVCGGVTPACLEVGLALYEQAVSRIVPVSSTRVAEMTKLLENIHRAVNIGLVNEMKIVADRMGIDIHEVIDAAATKPFGFTPYQPGPGLGGHCIPIDPFYLTWKAREFGLHTRFIELAGEINNRMPEWVIGKVMEALNERRKPLRGSRVLVLGIAYKKNVDDARESPSSVILELLRDKGADFAYSDPYFPRFPEMREHTFDLESAPLTPETLREYDCVILVTNHDSFDYEMILANSDLIVDTRGVYRQESPNVVRA